MTPMLHLHLIRHPKPAIDPALCYGQLDVDVAADPVGLADLGHRLRALLPLIHAGLPFYSSPLQRCRKLAEAIAPSHPPQLDKDWAEINFGDWEGQPWSTIGATTLDAWAADIGGYVPPGGESAHAVQARAIAAVQRLTQAMQANTQQEAIIVTHTGIIRLLLAHWLGLGTERWLQLQPDYASITTVALPVIDPAQPPAMPSPTLPRLLRFNCV